MTKDLNKACFRDTVHISTISLFVFELREEQSQSFHPN